MEFMDVPFCIFMHQIYVTVVLSLTFSGDTFKLKLCEFSAKIMLKCGKDETVPEEREE